MSDTTPEQRIAAECLGGRVRVLNRVVTAIYEEGLRPLKLRVSQMNILVVIAAHGPMRATDVCRKLALDKTTMSRDLVRLVDRGWVRSTPGVGRAQTLEITESGRTLVRSVEPAWEKAQRKVREILGDDLLAAIMQRVNHLRQADGQT